MIPSDSAECPKEHSEAVYHARTGNQPLRRQLLAYKQMQTSRAETFGINPTKNIQI